MVKFKFVLIFAVLFSVICFSSAARAEYIVGVSTNSWQELLPVVVQNVQSDALSTFSSLGVSLGYQFHFSDRFLALSSLALMSGSVDVHKQTNAIAPRRNFTSLWFSNKLMWRSTKTFSYGPNIVANYRKLEGASSVLSFGAFLDMDFDIFEEVRLTQSLGTMSDSKQIAYSISLNRVF
jgi:hypothetical protein